MTDLAALDAVYAAALEQKGHTVPPATTEPVVTKPAKRRGRPRKVAKAPAAAKAAPEALDPTFDAPADAGAATEVLTPSPVPPPVVAAPPPAQKVIKKNPDGTWPFTTDLRYQDRLLEGDPRNRTMRQMLDQVRGSLENFAKWTMRTPGGNPVTPDCILHRDLVKHIERVERGEAKRLLIVAPPRHAKSTWSSLALPAWFLGRNPARRVMLVSNTAETATQFSLAVRANMMSDHFRLLYPLAIPDPDRSWTQAAWTLVRPAEAFGGADVSFVATGVMSTGLPGRGADLIILDDVVTQETAGTEAQRAKLETWLMQTVFSRLEPGGAIVCLGHRWHSKDFYGTLMEAGWETIRYKAIDDCGKALWPARWPVEELKLIEKPRPDIFAATYQGEPAELSEGAFIRRSMIEIIDGMEIPEGAEVGVAVDCAMSQKAGADYFVAVVGYRTADGGLVVPHMVRGRFPFTEQLAVIDRLIKRYSPYVVGIERAAGGQQLIEMLRDRCPSAWVKQLDPIADKVTRAARLIALFEAGQVQLGADFRGVDGEIAGFPVAEHDDVVDALAWLTHLPLTPWGGADAKPVDLSPVYYGSPESITVGDPWYVPDGHDIASAMNEACGFSREAYQ